MTTPPCAADPETWFPNPQDQETTDYAVYSATDPPVRALRRLIPPVRLGSVSIDLSFLILMVSISLLMSIL